MPATTGSTVPILWGRGLPQDEGHYWDEAVPETLSSRDPEMIDMLPPRGMDLSDAWTAKIVETTDITGQQRHLWYPKVFASKGLHQDYVMKGKAG